ncbi:MAG: hypothetical protein WD228_07585 [Mycobacterium sp.]
MSTVSNSHPAKASSYRHPQAVPPLPDRPVDPRVKMGHETAGEIVSLGDVG